MPLQHATRIRLSVIALACSCVMWSPAQDLEPDIRSKMAMGFTNFPYDITQQAVDDTYAFLAGNANLVTYHLDDKVPWPEALAGQHDYHPNVVSEIMTMAQNVPPGHQVYVSTTPQDTARAGTLAHYWAHNDGLPLPADWSTKTLDHPDTLVAFTNWCRFLIDTLAPDYFAFAIECNAGFRGPDDPALDQFITLARHVYATLKDEYQGLPVFLTVQTASFQMNGEPLMEVTARVLAHSDYVALSSYPYLIPDPERLITHGDPAFIPENLLSRVAELAPEKPFALAETGYIAQPLDLPELNIFQDGTSQWQEGYLALLLDQLASLNAVFLVWFVARDHDLMNESLIELGIDLESIFFLWRDTGILDGDGYARPALTRWRHQLGAGDIDNNGRVNEHDLAVIIRNYGHPAEGGYGQGDLDGNGWVDAVDLAWLMMSEHW